MIPYGAGKFRTAIDVTAGAVATLVLAEDGARSRAHVKCLASNTQPIRVGDENVAANRGTQLTAGEGLTLEGSGAIYVIREAAGTVNVTTTMEVRQ